MRFIYSHFDNKHKGRDKNFILEKNLTKRRGYKARKFRTKKFEKIIEKSGKIGYLNKLKYQTDIGKDIHS